MDDLEKRFTYHAPTEGQPEIYETIRSYGKAMAIIIDTHCVDSVEKTLAIRKVEEAVMWANASVARGSK